MNSEHAPGNNILLVANWESNVGYAWWLMENFWVTISDHFQPKGQRCYLIYPVITQIPESIIASDISADELDFLDRSRKNLKSLYKFIRSNKIRYIYLSDAPAYSLFYARLRLLGIKKIVVHDHTPGERTIPPRWIRLIKKMIQRLPWVTADHYIAVTGFVYKRFIDVSCIPSVKCSVAPNGIKPVDLTSPDKKYAHRVFNIPQTRQIVLTTGRATHYKGIDFIIKCLAELIHARKVTDLHFIFCGDGPDLENFINLAKKLEVIDYMTFAGQRSDIRAILPSCDIGFHASRGEVGYSLSILEYMSAGLATIVPDLASTSEAIIHEENGLVFRHGDLGCACDMLQRCRSAVYRQMLSKAAIAAVIDQYNIEQTNQSLIQILDRIYLTK